MNPPAGRPGEPAGPAPGEGPPGVRAIDHTGDAGLEIEAADPAELFRRAAEGLTALIGDGGGGERLERTVTVEAGDRPALLRSWLRELLHLYHVEGFTYVGADFEKLGADRLRARVEGRAAPGRPAREIKGVTLHGLAVEERPDGWLARVIFDL